MAGLIARLFRRKATFAPPPPAPPRPRPAARSYAMSTVDRLSADFRAPISTADAELRYSLQVMRARARELSRNNDYAKRFLSLVKNNVIGPKGIQLQMRVKNPDGTMDEKANAAIERAWSAWGHAGFCTADGRLSWVDAQRLFVETLARDGEVLVRKVPGFANPFRFALQFVEADHLDESLDNVLRDGRRLKMGVEVNEWDRPVAYWLRSKHPGEYTYAGQMPDQYQRHPAETLIHKYLVERPTQTRGVPWMHTPAARMHILNKYEEAELVASRVAAAKMGFFTKEKGTAAGFAGDDTDDDGNTITEAAPGTFQELPAGMDFKPFDPEHPTANFDAFCKGILRGICAGLDVSYTGLTGDLTAVNYSSIRAGLLDERDAWRFLQYWTIEHFCLPIFTEWLWLALLAGAIPGLPVAKYDKFLAPEFRPRGWAWVDPEKDASASEKAIGAGLNTYTEVLAEQGRDFEDTVAQLAYERKALTAAGIPLLNPAGPAKPKEKADEKDAQDQG